jgi:hypothetical protein
MCEFMYTVRWNFEPWSPKNSIKLKIQRFSLKRTASKSPYFEEKSLKLSYFDNMLCIGRSKQSRILKIFYAKFWLIPLVDDRQPTYLTKLKKTNPGVNRQSGGIKSSFPSLSHVDSFSCAFVNMFRSWPNLVHLLLLLKYAYLWIYFHKFISFVFLLSCK